MNQHLGGLGPKWPQSRYTVHYFWSGPMVKSSALYRELGAIWVKTMEFERHLLQAWAAVIVSLIDLRLFYITSIAFS
jgi:hypothetical protein